MCQATKFIWNKFDAPIPLLHNAANRVHWPRRKNTLMYSGTKFKHASTRNKYNFIRKRNVLTKISSSSTSRRWKPHTIWDTWRFLQQNMPLLSCQNSSCMGSSVVTISVSYWVVCIVYKLDKVWTYSKANYLLASKGKQERVFFPRIHVISTGQGRMVCYSIEQFDYKNVPHCAQDVTNWQFK